MDFHQVIYPICLAFVPAPTLRSCSNRLLQVPRSKLKSNDDRRFSIAGPKLWNSIPASLRNADSLNSFKKHLKTYLIRQAFFDLEIYFYLISMLIYVVVRFF